MKSSKERGAKVSVGTIEKFESQSGAQKQASKKDMVRSPPPGEREERGMGDVGASRKVI